MVVFCCCELSHVIFLKLRKKKLLAKLNKLKNDNYFHSKRQPRTTLSENNCHFVNLLSFASSPFFLSMRKITCLNSQQPKTRGHVEHPRLASAVISTVLPLVLKLRSNQYASESRQADATLGFFQFSILAGHSQKLSTHEITSDWNSCIHSIYVRTLSS